MKYSHILVRFGELTTKGKNRKMFINRLFENIKESLHKYQGLQYQKTFDRIYIQLNHEKAEDVCQDLKNVFGIYSFSLAIKIDTSIENMQEAALMIMNTTEGKTFKIETKRSFKQFPMKSDDVNRSVAGFIFDHINKDISVDVHQPSIRLKIEIRENNSYVMNHVIKASGGYPVGVGGKALLMLSGGIDSPVAGYLTLKRGVQIECIHYASPPYTNERAKQKVLDITRKLVPYCGSIVVHMIPFTKLQLAIYEHTSESYAMTIMRRMMYRIAEEIAIKRNCLAIVNGESIGQVASQTLDSMVVINEVMTTLPVIRPVACMDKLDIIEIAKKIDTYDISIRPFEDCCTIFTPKNPTTKPKSYKAKAFEETFDYTSLLEECCNEVETMIIKNQEIEDNNDLF